MGSQTSQAQFSDYSFYVSVCVCMYMCIYIYGIYNMLLYKIYMYNIVALLILGISKHFYVHNGYFQLNFNEYV